MATLRTVTFRWAAMASAATGVAVAACSSDNNPATTVSDASAGVDVGVDASAPADSGKTLSLQWKVVLLGAPPVATDGGIADAASGEGGTHSDAGSPDAAATITVLDGVIPADGAAPDTGGPDAGAAPDGAAGRAGISDLPPLAGVQICVYKDTTIPCATTGADGTFTLTGLPSRANLAITFQKTGFTPNIVPIETASTDMDGRANPIFMSPATAAPPAIGVPVDLTTKGAISAFAVVLGGGAADGGGVSGLRGTQISLTPPSGNGPYFVNDQNQIDLSSTSFVGATALYYNVAPGTYTLTYANPTYDCEPISFPFGQFGYPVTAPPHSLQLIVVPGYITGIVGALCTRNATIVNIDGG